MPSGALKRDRHETRSSQDALPRRQRLPAGQAEVVAEMGPMILGPGLYRVQAELLSDGRTLATAGVVFKVVAERALTGGQPVLWAPIEVSCRSRVTAER